MYALIIIYFTAATGAMVPSSKTPVYPTKEACVAADNYLGPFLQGKISATQPGTTVFTYCGEIVLNGAKSE